MGSGGPLIGGSSGRKLGVPPGLHKPEYGPVVVSVSVSAWI